MANTTVQSRNTIQITGLDADWLWDTEFSEIAASLGGMWVRSIQFNPSAANDVMIINDGGIDGPSIFDVKCTADTDQRVKYFDPPLYCAPVIDITDCTLGTAANAKVIITLD